MTRDIAHPDPGVSSTLPSAESRLHTVDRTDIGRASLSDMDILAAIPPRSAASQHNGNATRIEKCIWIGCVAIASSGCQKFCTKHFCELYRNNMIAIEQENETRSKPRRSKPALESTMKPSDADIVESAVNSSDDLEYTNNHKIQRPLKSCAGPMCYEMTSSNLCRRCQSKCFQGHSKVTESSFKPKRKCPSKTCANEAQKSTTGLCKECYNVLLEANSQAVPMPGEEKMYFYNG